MSFNGSGTFVINSAGQPVVANTVISATTFNALTADLANGLTTCITKDGQTTPTANIPMGGFKITNLATGTAATDAATVAQIQSNGAALVTVTGTDTLTGSLTPALVAYVTGAVYYFVAPATNTGAVTLNIDTLGAKNVTRDGTTALVAGDIVSGEMVAVVYDGTRFQLISPVNSFTNLNVSGTLTVAGTATLNGNVAIGDAAADTINFKSSGWTLTNNVSVIGTWADIGTITTADINGGTIDGTTIGGGTAAAGTFTTATATTGNITTVNATTVDSTNLEVTNLKAKDGTAAGSIADATGVVTLNSVVATTADINGGTIDATTIGGSSPAVGNFTTVSAASAVFTTATITTVNTTTLDLTNLEVTNIKAKDGTASMTIDDATGKVNATTVSAASMNAGVAAVTSLTATGASVASANVGTAVITNGTVTALTATGASIASMNAGVALLTTATVTNFTASGASIASANIGNLQFTAASIASINAGVAVITNLTATGASIASANVGTAVITAATVTGASIASMNAGVALLTTATVTNLTATSASIASANVGTAVVTGLTVTGASIASVNAGVAVLSGNLTLNGGTANGVLYLNGSKVATSGSALVFDGSKLGINRTPSAGYALDVDTSSGSYQRITGSDQGNVRLRFDNGGTGGRIWELVGGLAGANNADFSIRDVTGGTSPLVITSTSLYTASGINVGIGTSSPAYKLDVSGTSRFSSTIGIGTPPGTYGGQVDIFANSNAAFNGIWVRNDSSGSSANAGIVLNASGNSWRMAMGSSANNNNALSWVVDVTGSPSEKMQLTTAGNLGLGVTPSAFTSTIKAFQIGSTSVFRAGDSGFTQATIVASNARQESAVNYYIANGFATDYTQQAGAHIWYNAPSGTAGNAISFTQAMTLDASGNLLVGNTTQLLFTNKELNVNAASGSAGFALATGGTARLYMTGSSSDGNITTKGAIPLLFGTNETERARITAGGYFKASNDGTYFSTTGTVHEFRNSAGDNHTLVVHNTASTLSGSGARGIYINYTASPNATDRGFVACFDGNGANERATIRSNGGLANYQSNNVDISDARTKKDIAPAASMWGKIGALEIVTYKYNDQTHDDVNLGVIAQQVESVEPVWVDADGFGDTPEDGVPLKTVYTKDITFAAIKALQEAMARIEQLEADMAALKASA